MVELGPRIFNLREHEYFCENDRNEINSLSIDFQKTEFGCAPKYLGITPDLQASYYVGASWLDDERHRAVVIRPKLKEIDLVEMFLEGLKLPEAASYFAGYYGISFNEELIPLEMKDDQLTILLVVHFLSVMDILVKKGLKRGYVERHLNLDNRIKGRIRITSNIRNNLATAHMYRNYCVYSDYSADIPENRLLKKALVFSQKVLLSYPAFLKHSSFTELFAKVNRLLVSFVGVSDEISMSEIRGIKPNRLYKDTNKAVDIAKMLLKRFDYSITNVDGGIHSVPPFWIDMSRLYEVYVYSKLEKAYPGMIGFQVQGHCSTAVDFVKYDEKIIMDAKYKPGYDKENTYLLNDIREISGYARDNKILTTLGISNDSMEIPKCIIIYSSDREIMEEAADTELDALVSLSAFDESRTLLEQCSKESRWYRGFYKIRIPLPVFNR